MKADVCDSVIRDGLLRREHRADRRKADKVKAVEVQRRIEMCKGVCVR